MRVNGKPIGRHDDNVPIASMLRELLAPVRPYSPAAAVGPWRDGETQGLIAMVRARGGSVADFERYWINR